MCLPKRTTRFMILITSIILIGTGGFFIWWGNEYRDHDVTEANDLEPLFITILAIGTFLILLGGFGIFNAIWDNKLFMCIFAPLLLAFALFVIIGGIGFLAMRGKADEVLDDKDSCRDYDIFKDADDELLNVADQFCTTNCECNLRDPDNLSTKPKGGQYSGSAIRVQQCPCEGNQKIQGVDVDCDLYQDQWMDDWIHNDDYFDFLEWMEDSLDCSGMCTDIGYYMFTDINHGKPDDDCLSSLRDWIKEKFLIFGIVSLLLGMFFIAVTFMACNLCNTERKLINMAAPPHFDEEPSDQGDVPEKFEESKQ